MVKTLTQTSLILGLLLISSLALAKPTNLRLVEDEFYASGMPHQEDIQEIYDLGIRTLVSLHPMDSEATKKAKELGIKIYKHRLHNQLVEPEFVIEVLESQKTKTVLIHCKHGADRTGAIIAYWLVTRKGWDPPSALYSVLAPSDSQIKGLHEVLASEGYVDLELDPDLLGIYTGSYGGLKASGKNGYQKLIRSFLEKIELTKTSPTDFESLPPFSETYPKLLK
jgi:protein tyrosine phosphatase (PTP) superfamily phosphohydrolase (DUF442 family)